MGIGLVRNNVNGIEISRYYRLVLRHPLLVFMVFVIFWIYRFFPLLFSVLVHASPVIVSTLVLLGTLLYYGHANNVTQNQTQGKPYHHRHDHFNLVNYSINFDSHHHQELGKLTEEDRRRRRRGSDVVNSVNRGGQFGPFMAKDFEPKTGSSSRSRSVVDVLHNAQSQGVDDKGWGDMGSDDLVETSSSSSDSSVNDTFPMLDELHTLIQSKDPKQMVNETDDYDDYDDDDQEVRDYEDDQDTLIMWTEDDQRNLLNLGTSELERNQCLENLIARQKALKNTRMMVEKSNLFDLPNDPISDKHDRPVEPIFHSTFVAVQPNDPFIRPHEGPSTLGQVLRDGTNNDYSAMNGTNTESIGLTHGEINPSGQPDSTCVKEGICTSDISDDKLRGANETVYQDKTRSSSSLSSFCDVTDDMYGGQDDEEEEFKSISTEDSNDLQVEESLVDDSTDEEVEKGRLHRRLSKVQRGLTSWFGWKA